MNVHVSYKGCKTPEIENQIQVLTEKLRRRLQVFRSDLIHLHAGIEQNPAKEAWSVSLNLRLPSGQIAASAEGLTAVAALKPAFDDLQEQVTKHKSRLRDRYKWSDSREARQARRRAQVPFEETIAAVRIPVVSAGDVASWVNANLVRLNRFVDRELRFRVANGLLRSGAVTPNEVVDEAIAEALGENSEKPEPLALEPWLYRLAMRAIDELVRRNSDPALSDRAVELRRSARLPNVEGSDEALLQYHQPDEAMTAQDNIADRRASNPEEVATSDEMVSLVNAALRGARREEREAFLLFAIEGFSPEEIAAISERPVALIEKSIEAARARLRAVLPLDLPTASSQ
jgi:DNA-directed RNA polymerase specialized sigma24 family protein/ribosome-associated translation inhibitor RaiA